MPKGDVNNGTKQLGLSVWEGRMNVDNVLSIGVRRNKLHY